jgi:integrase
MTTHIVSFSDSTIRRFADMPAVSQLRDPRYGLRFRYGNARTSGSWHLYKCLRGREIWRKIGNWPQLKAKDVIANLSIYEAKLSADLDADTLNGEFKTVGELLTWYRERSRTDRNISASRKATIKWAINCHLLSRLSAYHFTDLDHAELDETLFWPLQERYSNSTVRAVWGVFKQAVSRAHKQKRIANNPLAGYQFSDFIEQSIEAKATEIQTDNVPVILERSLSVSVPARTLGLMMLLHGCRIGETRLAKWAHFDLAGARWYIPANHTKTKAAHDLPLTRQAKQVLTAYRTWQQERGYTGAYLFPNQRQRRPINHNMANTLIRELSQGEWRSHSLRKAARTIWADIGIDYLIGELLLNHSMSKLDQAYIHTFAESRKREALEKYHDWLDRSSCFFFSGFDTETLPRSKSNTN